MNAHCRIHIGTSNPPPPTQSEAQAGNHPVAYLVAGSLLARSCFPHYSAMFSLVNQSVAACGVIRSRVIIASKQSTSPIHYQPIYSTTNTSHTNQSTNIMSSNLTQTFAYTTDPSAGAIPATVHYAPPRPAASLRRALSRSSSTPAALPSAPPP